jgi:hypothetical protein
MVKTKNKYILYVNGKESEHAFTGVFPRAAALKAAVAGFNNIELRQTGTKKLHVFEGHVEFIVPKNIEVLKVKTPWIVKDGKVKKAFVKKIGIKKL